MWEAFRTWGTKGAGRRLEANTAPGINEVLNAILKEVIMVYPDILEAQ